MAVEQRQQLAAQAIKLEDAAAWNVKQHLTGININPVQIRFHQRHGTHNHLFIIVSRWLFRLRAQSSTRRTKSGTDTSMLPSPSTLLAPSSTVATTFRRPTLLADILRSGLGPASPGTKIPAALI